MSWLEPQKRTLLFFIISIVTLVFYLLFFNQHIITIIDIAILSILFLTIYLISYKVDIRITDILFYATILLGAIIITIFNNSSLALNISIKNWEKNIKDIAITHCSNSCLLKGHSLYNYNNVEIYNWENLDYIYDGIIYTDNEEFSYQISFEDKCVIKELNKDLVIEKETCKKEQN